MTERKEKETKRKEKPDENSNFKGTVLSVPFSLYRLDSPRTAS